MTRRDLGKAAAAMMAGNAMAARRMDSRVRGVQLGLQSYVFTAGVAQVSDGLPDAVIAAMVAARLGECDLYAPIVEPPAIWNRIRARGTEVAAAREELAAWRRSVSLDHYRGVRKKFEDAGIAIYGLSGFPGSNEEELTRTYQIAEVLGAKLVTLGVTMPAARRIVPLAEKYSFVVGIQGNPDMNPKSPEVIGRPAEYEQAIALSPKYSMSFDIGDAVGGGYDVVPFVEAHHERIAMIYLKDRRKDRTSVPWGEGDTPVAEILRMIRDRKYAIRCFVDCDYPTNDRAGDVRRSADFARKVLVS